MLLRGVCLRVASGVFQRAAGLSLEPPVDGRQSCWAGAAPGLLRRLVPLRSLRRCRPVLGFCSAVDYCDLSRLRRYFGPERKQPPRDKAIERPFNIKDGYLSASMKS